MTMKVESNSRDDDDPSIDTQTNIFLGNPIFNVTTRPTSASATPEAHWREVIRLHGDAAPAHVSGDFAVALKESDGRTFLATDRFGIRSLCYRVVGKELQFAERADALTGAHPEIDPQAVFDYLYSHIIPSPRTIFKGVFRVPAGHYVRYEQGNLMVAPYWTPDFSEQKASFTDLKDEFRQILRNSVQSQLDGRNVGCFLSGGTDSSTLTGLLGEVSGKPAQAFTIGFDAKGYDEMEYSRLAARHFDADLHEYYITPDDLVHSIPNVASSYDQPFGNASALPAYYCAKMAKEAGIEHLLGGDGGDELFGGNTRYAKQKVFGHYEAIPEAIRARLLEPILLGTPPMARIPGIKKAVSYVDQARVPMPDRMQTYNLLTRLGRDQISHCSQLTYDLEQTEIRLTCGALAEER